MFLPLSRVRRCSLQVLVQAQGFFGGPRNLRQRLEVLSQAQGTLGPPAIWRSNGPAFAGRTDPKGRHRDCTRSKSWVPRFPVVAPGPKLPVGMPRRGTIEVPASLAHQGGSLVGHVAVLRVQGRLRQEDPKDLVGFSTTGLTLMRQQHEVPHSLRIELEELKDLDPLCLGHIVHTSLHQGHQRTWVSRTYLRCLHS